MTNFEKYKEDILKIINSGYDMLPGVVNGKVVACETIRCNDCELHRDDDNECQQRLFEWLYEDDGDRMIKDSGNRTEYKSGAVRDIQEGKGRCDLMPLDVVAGFFRAGCNYEAAKVIEGIYKYHTTHSVGYLVDVVMDFMNGDGFHDANTALLEVSKHFEEGAAKYGENNWQKGIPESSYIDSAVRHYLKWLRGDDDERHDRAFVWNIMCLIWTREHITNKQPETDKMCVETGCYYNNDCMCTTPAAFVVDETAGKECPWYSED